MINNFVNKERGFLKDIPVDVGIEFQKLKNVLMLSPNKNFKMILLHSSLPGEGSTSVSINLASAFATEEDKKILFIDFNFRSQFFGDSQGQKGISDLVLNDEELNKVIHKSNLKNLYYMTAGLATKNPAIVLESSKLDSKIAEIKEHFNIVIWDSSPASIFPESLYLGRKVDMIIIVAEADKIKREVIKGVIDAYRYANIQITGVVLNKKNYYIPNFIYKRL